MVLGETMVTFSLSFQSCEQRKPRKNKLVKRIVCQIIGIIQKNKAKKGSWGGWELHFITRWWGRPLLAWKHGIWSKTWKWWVRKPCRYVRDCIPCGKNERKIPQAGVYLVYQTAMRSAINKRQTSRKLLRKGKQKRNRLCKTLFHGTVWLFLWGRWGITRESLVKTWS